ncbi:transcriptional regulator family: Homeodomain [Trichoderma aggressivum f. europaeum]|uniref:Transcriptional regulator family: Homeodomain n=1 Tax=Trichoderma aggressivum f. europaeum TaxID=173218 RepID=A0AAE1M2T2_9HYPO|nr:transcriptional regulator family: Homeodomain [Trichoderma aggressivum f. europaeum]
MENAPGNNSTRPTTRHSWSSTQLLRQWYTSNLTWPYPSAAEKEELSRQTSLSVRQVSQWFVNARRRDAERQSSELTDISANPVSLSLPGSFDATQEQRNNVEAIDRLQRSSSSGAIPQLVTQDALDGIGSQDEAHSSNPSDSGHRSGHRRNSRTGWRHKATNEPAEERNPRIYQCTFCTDTFKSRYDWTRHEATLHLALERWSCLPAGPKRWDLGAEAPKCSLCDSSDTTDAHLESHHISDCIMKPQALRTFHRKDHLLQHLRLAHGIDKMIPSMHSWKSKISQVKSRCGFCGETFTLWSDRNDHLVDHFRRGKSMKDWNGDRGLEPSIAMLVQSAMPPYLIGAESLDLEPFSASKGVLKKTLSSPEKQNPPNVFEVLTARLGDFVVSARANGDTINCDILRRQARLILYGDDDPLNQTPADNDQWLTLFKIGHGLASAPGQQELAPSLPDEASQLASHPITISDTNKSSLPREAIERKSGSKLVTSQTLDNTEPTLPWWCQSPECLAELMEISREFSLTTLGNIEIDDESTRES